MDFRYEQAIGNNLEGADEIEEKEVIPFLIPHAQFDKTDGIQVISLCLLLKN